MRVINRSHWIRAVLFTLTLASASYSAAWPNTCDAFQNSAGALKQLRKRTRSSPGSHKVKTKKGRVILVIGEFHKRQKKFAASLLKALEAGALDEVSVGHLDHPKMLRFLTALLEKANREKSTLIWGYVDPSRILADVTPIERSLLSLDFKLRAEQISESENDKVSTAIDALKLREACARLFGTTEFLKCTNMKFKIDTSQSNPIVWERSDFDDWFLEEAG